MGSNRRSATITPTIDWTALIESTEPEVYSPTFRGSSAFQHIWPSTTSCGEDSVCVVIDTEGAAREDLNSIDTDEEGEGEWSDTERNYSTADQEQSDGSQLGRVGILQTFPCPWVVHVPRMEREISNALLHLGRAPTDRELAELMGLAGINGVARLFLLLEDIGGTLDTQRQKGCCVPDVGRPHIWLLRSLRFRALRAEMQKVLRDAMCDVCTADNVHMSLHYRDEPSRESATLEVFHGHPSCGKLLLDITVYADDRVCTEQEPEAEKSFQVKTCVSQNGALRRRRPFDCFHDDVRLQRSIISWYWLRNSHPPVRWQRRVDYHVTILSR